MKSIVGLLLILGIFVVEFFVFPLLVFSTPIIGNGAGPYPSSVITVYNDASFVPSEVSQGEISICFSEVGGYGGWKDSIQYIPLEEHRAIVVTPGVYVLSVVMTVINSFDGTFYDPCTTSLNPDFVYWSGRVSIKNDNLNYILTVSGTELRPVVRFYLAKNITELNKHIGVFSPWIPTGAGKSPVAMTDHKARLFQAVRGTDNNIYTRFSTDGKLFSDWIPNGATLEKVSMVSYFGKIYQTVRGTDSNIYTRTSDNGIEWTEWQPEGATFGYVASEILGAQLVQAVRGTDNNIYTRVQLPNQPWSPWTPKGSTFGTITLEVFRNNVYQAVRGTDNAIYIRFSRNPLDPTSWSDWKYIVKNSTTGEAYRSLFDPHLAVFNNVLFLSFSEKDGNLIMMRVDSELNLPQGRDQEIQAIYSSISGVESTAIQNTRVVNFGLHTVRDNQNQIRSRVISNFAFNPQWDSWSETSGQTELPIVSYSYENSIVQSIIGTDNNIYTRTFSYSEIAE